MSSKSPSPSRLFSILLKARDKPQVDIIMNEDWKEEMDKVISEYNIKDHIDNIIMGATNFKYILSSNDVVSNMYPMNSRIWLNDEDDNITESDLIENIFRFVTNGFMKKYGDDQVWIDLLHEICNDLYANKEFLFSKKHHVLCSDLTTTSGHVGSYELSHVMKRTKKWRRCSKVDIITWYGNLKIYALPNISKHGFRYMNITSSAR